MKKTLWENVRALMMERYGEENLNRLARDAKIGVGSVARIKEAQTSVGLDVIEAIAKVFKVQPFTLIIPAKEKAPYASLAKDPGFLLIARAYAETDKAGKEILLANAQILLGRAQRGDPEAGEVGQG